MRLVAAAGFLALAAGCGSSSPTATSPAGGSSSPARPAAPASPASPATSPPAAPASTSSPNTPAVAGPGPCPTSGLKVATGSRQGAAGSVYVVLNFTNTSGTTCTLYGYPGVALAGSTRAQIGAPASRSPSGVKKLVTLPPGTTGSATLRITQAENYPTATCGPVPASYLQIYPPNQTADVDVPYQAQACSKQLVIMSIGTVAYGTSG